MCESVVAEGELGHMATAVLTTTNSGDSAEGWPCALARPPLTLGGPAACAFGAFALGMSDRQPLLSCGVRSPFVLDKVDGCGRICETIVGARQRAFL